MARMILCGEAASDRMHTMRLLCEEKRADYLVRGGTARSHAPSLQHGHVALYDIRAIARYVDSVFDGIRLYPAPPSSGGEIDRWIAWIDEELRPALCAPSGACADAGRCMEQLQRTVSRQGFLCGPEPNLVDFYLFPLLDRLLSSSAVEAVPDNIRNYHETMSMRDSVWTLPYRRKRNIQ